MTLPKAISDAIDAFFEEMYDDYQEAEGKPRKPHVRTLASREALERAIAEHVAPVAAPQPDGFPNDGKLHAVLRGSVEVNGRKFAYTGTVRNWHTLPGDTPPSKGPLYEIEALNLPFRQTWATGIAENVADAEASLCQVLANIMAAEPKGDAPTEAEIEAWKVCAMGWSVDKAKEPPILQPQPDDVGKDGEAFLVVRSEIEEAVALMRRAAAATRSWNGGPTVTALMRGVEDAAIEWGKCVGDYNAACQAAPPPSGLEASEAVREAGHKCELAYGYFQKAIKALADHRASPAPSALERLRERVQHEFDGCDTSRSNTSFTRGQTLGSVLDWIDEERERPSET